MTKIHQKCIPLTKVYKNNSIIASGYKSLSQKNRHNLKNFIREKIVNVADKTIQRWYYRPIQIPAEYYDAVIAALRMHLTNQNNENRTIAQKIKTQALAVKAKQRVYVQFIKTFTYDN